MISTFAFQSDLAFDFTTFVEDLSVNCRRRRALLRLPLYAVRVFYVDAFLNKYILICKTLLPISASTEMQFVRSVTV